MTSLINEAKAHPGEVTCPRRCRLRHILTLERGAFNGVMRAFMLIASLACSLIQSAHAQSGATTQNADAVRPVAALYAGLQKLESSAGQGTDARVAMMTPVIDNAFDLNIILQNSVGLRFKTLSPQERTNLLAAFRNFTVARYVSSFGKGDKVVFTITPEVRGAPYGHGDVVRTTISGDNGKTDLDYIVTRGANGYRITDILLNGHISQVAAQRADFSSTLSSGGAAGLQSLLDTKSRSFLSN